MEHKCKERFLDYVEIEVSSQKHIKKVYWFLILNNTITDYTVSCKINYCPFCGLELEETEN